MLPWALRFWFCLFLKLARINLNRSQLSTLMAIVYSSALLRSLVSSNCKTKLSSSLWNRLTALGISKVKPTRRGSRGGLQRIRQVPVLRNLADHLAQCVDDGFVDNTNCYDENGSHEIAHLHFSSPGSLNIRIGTSDTKSPNCRSIPVIWTLSRPPVRLECLAGAKSERGRFLSRVAAVTQPSGQAAPKDFGVSLLLANTMSMAPKIDEIWSVILNLI